MTIDNTKSVNPTKIKMTEAQQKQFDEDGFFLIEDALSASEVEELIAVIDEAYEKYRREKKLGPHDPFQIRNIVAYHPKFQAMIDHPKILPLVVDGIGYNIQIRTSHIADPERVVEVNVRPGTAMVWRTALFHAVTPNLSTRTRKCLYYGYSHRWLRPSDYDHQPAEILVGCNPVQRQLLGELGTGDLNYTGDDPLIHPVSRFWRPLNEDIPIKSWAETQLASLN